MFGLVAVTGVVVNDSLIMVDFINRARAAHTGVGRMARQAGGGPTDPAVVPFVSLILVPTSYMILDDVGRALRQGSGNVSPRKPRCSAEPSNEGRAGRVVTAAP